MRNNKNIADNNLILDYQESLLTFDELRQWDGFYSSIDTFALG